MSTNTSDINFTKADLKSPDQMTKTLREGFVWTTNHSKLVIGLIAAFIVIGGGTAIIQHFSQAKETALQTKYFTLEKNYNELHRNFTEANRAEATPVSGKDKKAPAVDPAKKASGDLTKDYGSVVAGFEALINEAPTSKAAQMAALNLSNLYLEYKKNDEALAVLHKIESGINKSSTIGALIHMQMGSILAGKNDCKAAVAIWQKLTDTKSLQFAHNEAKLRMGLCYEAMNETAKAESLYTEIAKKEDSMSGADVAAAHDAGKFLRLLKAKKSL